MRLKLIFVVCVGMLALSGCSWLRGGYVKSKEFFSEKVQVEKTPNPYLSRRPIPGNQQMLSHRHSALRSQQQGAAEALSLLGGDGYRTQPMWVEPGDGSY